MRAGSRSTPVRALSSAGANSVQPQQTRPRAGRPRTQKGGAAKASRDPTSCAAHKSNTATCAYLLTFDSNEFLQVVALELDAT